MEQCIRVAESPETRPSGKRRTRHATPESIGCVAAVRGRFWKTTNRGLAVLRRMLRLAHEWRIIDRVPRIHLLRGERNRDVVLNRKQERIYLEFAPQLLHDVAVLMLDTALGPAEALALMWRDIHFEASAVSLFGYLQVREGKLAIGHGA